MYFVDDTAFVFHSRETLATTGPVICDHMLRFGLLMHVGEVSESGKEEASKTECMFYPPPRYLNLPAMEAPHEDPNQHAIQICEARESQEAREKREDAAYAAAPETQRIWFRERSFIDFTTNF